MAEDTEHPDGFVPVSFDPNIKLTSHSIKDDNEVWLFKFPLDLDPADIAKLKCNLWPSPANQSVLSSTFEVNGTKYALMETPVEEANNVVNALPQDVDTLCLGKPFVRAFSVVKVHVDANEALTSSTANKPRPEELIALNDLIPDTEVKEKHWVAPLQGLKKRFLPVGTASTTCASSSSHKAKRHKAVATHPSQKAKKLKKKKKKKKTKK